MECKAVNHLSKSRNETPVITDAGDRCFSKDAQVSFAVQNHHAKSAFQCFIVGGFPTFVLALNWGITALLV